MNHQEIRYYLVRTDNFNFNHYINHVQVRGYNFKRNIIYLFMFYLFYFLYLQLELLHCLDHPNSYNFLDQLAGFPPCKRAQLVSEQRNVDTKPEIIGILKYLSDIRQYTNVR